MSAVASQPAAEVPVIDWRGCYDQQWRGLLVKEAFTHPAKFAPGLVARIYRHGLDRGYWKRGDLIGDPFGGIGGGGIVAALLGLRWVGVELEPRFVKLANANFALHADNWSALGLPAASIVQGDSRAFAELLCSEISGAVLSPPYADSVNRDGHGFDPLKGKQAKNRPQSAVRHYALLAAKTKYGNTPGQIGALSEGRRGLEGVVTSPPYAETLSHGGGPDTRQDLIQGGQSLQAIKGGYGAAAGQIGELREGSVDGVVTSPPFLHGRSDTTKSHGTRVPTTHDPQDMGNSPGQINDEGSETYWQAVATVYASVAQLLSPGGVMAVVVKDYVKKKARVPLCDRTLALLVHLGFEPIERARAWLVTERREAGLHGGDIVTRTERKSFFRRLAEKKGSPAIDWEEVLFVRKGGA